MGSENKLRYVIGIKVDSKEHYDRLMNELSEPGILFGINFKELFDGYPDGYPCLVEYYVGECNPFGFSYSSQMRKVVDAGYLVQVYLSKEEA